MEGRKSSLAPRVVLKCSAGMLCCNIAGMLCKGSSCVGRGEGEERAVLLKIAPAPMFDHQTRNVTSALKVAPAEGKVASSCAPCTRQSRPYPGENGQNSPRDGGCGFHVTPRPSGMGQNKSPLGENKCCLSPRGALHKMTDGNHAIRFGAQAPPTWSHHHEHGNHHQIRRAFG